MNKKCIDEYNKNEVTWPERCHLIASHPAAVRRYFNTCVQKFIKSVLFSHHAPLATVKDFFYHVQFQECGGHHIYGLLWVEVALNMYNTKMETFMHILTR